ncbi:MAG: hypothetical protein D6772_13610, partial [Bacteroidetes bacterium]
MRVSLLLSLCLLGWNCQRPTYTLTQLPDTYLVYGQGGGISGQETAVYLFPQGQRIQFQVLSRDTATLPPLKPKDARQRFAQADSLFRFWGGMQAPGNQYQFVKYYSDDT